MLVCMVLRLDPHQNTCPSPMQIRISNPTFGRHVRNAPGGEEFMHAAGWTVKVPARFCMPNLVPGSAEL